MSLFPENLSLISLSFLPFLPLPTFPLLCLSLLPSPPLSFSLPFLSEESYNPSSCWGYMTTAEKRTRLKKK
jgi:hypothetical protein